MKKTIYHKWFKLKGFKTFQCSRCGVIKRWDSALGKDIYEYKGKGYFLSLPQCVMPNSFKERQAEKEYKKFKNDIVKLKN
jgi:hypothetical protein